MKRNLIKKLNLKKETLRTLKSHQLERAQGAGGMASAVVVCLYTPACVAQTSGSDCIVVTDPTTFTTSIPTTSITTTSIPTTSIDTSWGY